MAGIQEWWCQFTPLLGLSILYIVQYSQISQIHKNFSQNLYCSRLPKWCCLNKEENDETALPSPRRALT